MTAPEEPIGPVIRDNRRIDPVTGQPKRGKHAASQPAGTTSASRPGGAGSGSNPGGANPGGVGSHPSFYRCTFSLTPNTFSYQPEISSDGKTFMPTSVYTFTHKTPNAADPETKKTATEEAGK